MFEPQVRTLLPQISTTAPRASCLRVIQVFLRSRFDVFEQILTVRDKHKPNVTLLWSMPPFYRRQPRKLQKLWNLQASSGKTELQEWNSESWVPISPN